MAIYHFERALFVVGEQNSGKSTQLRSMFRDVRLGNDEIIPGADKLREMYRLSNERCLYLRLTSPHEVGETLAQFLDKIAAKIEGSVPQLGRRWNFAGPLQPTAANHMPDVVATCRGFASRFNPERTRVAFLSPDRHEARLQAAHMVLVDGLRNIPSIEICWIDARDRTANGLLLCDFFDFT